MNSLAYRREAPTRGAFLGREGDEKETNAGEGLDRCGYFILGRQPDREEVEKQSHIARLRAFLRLCYDGWYKWRLMF